MLGSSCIPPVSKQAGAIGVTMLPSSSSAVPRATQVSAPPPVEVLAAAIAPGHAAAPFDAGDQSEDSARNSLRCLTDAVYYEARSQSEDGQRAVAQVVLNRVRHPAFPSSVCGVVYQGSQRRTGCQFSFTCDGSRSRPIEPRAWAFATRIAEEALAGQVYAPVGLATHFHTTAIHPWWAPSLSRGVTVGSHIFYRWRGEWGDPKAFRQPYSGVEWSHAYTDAGVAPPQGQIQTVAFGVRIHRAGSEEMAGSDEGETQPSAAQVRIHRSAVPHGIRIRVGVPPNGGEDVPGGSVEGAEAETEASS